MLKTILLVLAGLWTVLTALPFLRTDVWFVRALDFPRLQLAIVGGATAVALLFFWPQMSWPQRGVWGLLVAAVAWQGRCILPFTPLVRSDVPAAGAVEGRRLRLLVANVLQDNRDATRLVALVRETKPDLFLAMEVDGWWIEQLRVLRDDLPHGVDHPLDNTYGMALFSRIPLLDPQVIALTEDHVPSIHTAFLLDSGRRVRLHCLHPEPPQPWNDTEERDVALLEVAHRVKEEGVTAIVCGDLNDVAWSRTTLRFKEVSGMLDPRVGRGMFSTYHAHVPILRWPLDQLFCTRDFRLVDMDRLSDVGSDHFPLRVDLVLAP